MTAEPRSVHLMGTTGRPIVVLFSPSNPGRLKSTVVSKKTTKWATNLGLEHVNKGLHCSVCDLEIIKKRKKNELLVISLCAKLF